MRYYFQKACLFILVVRYNLLVGITFPGGDRPAVLSTSDQKNVTQPQNVVDDGFSFRVEGTAVYSGVCILYSQTE